MKFAKQFVFLACAICFASETWGAPVDSTTAADTVKGWLQTEQSPLGAKLGKQIGRVESHRDSAGATLYHIVNLKPTGFVIVAGDDAAEPIVAFISQGSFDPSEKNPLGALVARDMPKRVAQAHKIATSPAGLKNHAKWQKLQTTASAAGGGSVKPKSLATPLISDLRVDPLLVTTWDQATAPNGNACYNFFTPPHEAGNPANVVCGCVATMLAQMMYYYQYPTAGVGTNMFTFSFDSSPILWDWPLRGGDGQGGPYDWANMPPNPVNPTVSQCAAIGALTYDAGIAVHMQYSDTPAGSGAFMSDAKTALVTTFKYGNAIITESNSINIGFDLPNMINANLDAHLPVLFGIQNTDGGHAIVCDGYGYDGYNTPYHHLNMGWGGTDNAWYHLPLIDLTDTMPFNNFTACIYNVFTNTTGEIISGRVLDNSGTPLANAQVSATTPLGAVFSVPTDNRGIYALVGLPSNTTFTLIAAANGYFPVSQKCSTGRSLDESPACGNVWGINFSLLLAQGPPIFVTQPTSQSVVVGSAVSFATSVSGQLPLSFQWQYQPSGNPSWFNFVDGGGISGSQTSGLSINSVTLVMSGESVRCVATNSLGSANSLSATLVVVGIPPTFTIQPSSQSVVAGTNAVFTAYAAGTAAISYQWQFQPSGSLSWSNVVDDATNSGSQSTTLTVNPADLTQNGKPLQCVAANIWGSTTSSPAYLFVTPNNSMPISVYTLAGLTGIAGTNNGMGTNTLFNNPHGIAVDANTNIFVADMANQVIRMLSPTGSGWASATIAGLAGTSGTNDGTGSAARFNGPYGIALDGSGTNVIVADTGNHTLRKLSKSGTNWIATTIAGFAGASGTNDGSGATARFNRPMGVAAYGADNLFVADEANHTIRKVTFNGINWTTTTIAGLAGTGGTADGNNSGARFQEPYALTVNSSGRVYVAEHYYNCVRQIVPTGSNWVVSTIGISSTAGGSTDGSGTVARFKQPSGIVASPDGDVYVADSANDTIRRIAPNGLGWSVFTVAGLAGNSGSVDGTGTTVRMNLPFGIAVDANTNLYITDANNDTIRGAAPVVTPVPAVVGLFKLAQQRSLTITWNALVGHAYQVQYKTNLNQSAWSIYTNITAVNWTGTASVAVSADPQRFYRVVPAP